MYGFNKEVLQYARIITAKVYPVMSGGIDAGCLVYACMIFKEQGLPTLLPGT